MTRDSQTKISKTEQSKRSKKQELNIKKKKIQESDSDSNNDSENDNDDMDVHEYRKLLSNIFPSKHINNKIKSGEKLKKIIGDINDKNKKEINTNTKSKKNTKVDLSDEDVDVCESVHDTENKAKLKVSWTLAVTS